ncbi:uncharacterized protein LOC126912257 [Spodoptera frugiperda]|uniref:Uncharacterized protein LOC126912257 n=1 Tax=Spodoptera frugiperda TaxID=7108 RepID=A0A9R0F2S9_SPOFR|nr:uncharacterized protein LOC126912257 [Spodoptera frugiperda]
MYLRALVLALLFGFAATSRYPKGFQYSEKPNEEARDSPKILLFTSYKQQDPLTTDVEYKTPLRMTEDDNDDKVYLKNMDRLMKTKRDGISPESRKHYDFDIRNYFKIHDITKKRMLAAKNVILNMKLIEMANGIH